MIARVQDRSLIMQVLSYISQTPASCTPANLSKPEENPTQLAQLLRTIGSGVHTTEVAHGWSTNAVCKWPLILETAFLPPSPAQPDSP